MAFSTQKQFLKIGYIINDPEQQRLPLRKKSDALIKTYDSCLDARAWSMDKTKRAQYLADVVNQISDVRRRR